MTKDQRPIKSNLLDKPSTMIQSLAITEAVKYRIIFDYSPSKTITDNESTNGCNTLVAHFIPG